MRAIKVALMVISFATLTLAAPFARAVGAGQPCGGNTQNPPVCDTGLFCVPVPGGGPFGDVGGVCATAPAVPASPAAAVAIFALLLGALALRKLRTS
jgi:hypothetical protein